MTELRSFELGIGVVDPWTNNGEGNTKYFHTDHLGTTRFMSAYAGATSGVGTYTAFGERVSGSDHRYGYAGAWGYQGTLDDQTPPAAVFPFLHLGHRYYDPSSGRFLQRDPIGIQGGLNVYEYADSSPTDSIDPTGEVKHKSFRLTNKGRIRYGPSTYPKNARRVGRGRAFRVGSKFHRFGWRGAGYLAGSCVVAIGAGYAGGRGIDNGFGRLNRGYRISDGLADIIYRRIYGGDDTDYDPWG